MGFGVEGGNGCSYDGNCGVGVNGCGYGSGGSCDDDNGGGSNGDGYRCGGDCGNGCGGVRGNGVLCGQPSCLPA